MSREIEFKLKGVIGTKMLKPEKIEKLIADYYVALRGMEGTKWAAKFDEEATIEDPVGTKPITGGREVFEQFYRNAINANFQKIDIQEESVLIKPNQGAASWNFEGLTHQGVEIAFEGMTLFEFNESCLISSFKVYWNPTQVMPLLKGSKSVDSSNK